MTKIINVPKLIRNLWIILWIVELLLVGMKICFNVWYPIVVENEIILKLSDFITNNVIVNYVVMFVLYLVNLNFIYLISSREKFFKNKIEFLIISIIITCAFFIKKYDNTFGMIFESLVLIIIPTINNIRKIDKEKDKRLIKFLKIIFAIIVNVLVMIWQLNIYFIRGIEDILHNMPFIIYFAIQIDYYIFLIITWIGVNYYMGLVGAWFFSKKITKYSALRQKELAKEKPDFEYVAELDKKISDLEARMK